MSGTSTTQLTARFLTPDYLVQGSDNAISCPLWRDGALVAPTQAGSTVSVYDTSNNPVVNAAAVTVTGSIATYTVPASVLPSTLSRAMGWRVEWSLIVSCVTPSPTTYRNNAGLVKSVLAPMITDADLFRRESALNPAGNAPISSLADYQDYIDEAWVTLHGLIVGKGSLVHLVMEPSALREPLMCLTLAGIFEDFRTRLSEVWKEKAVDYQAKFERAFNGLAFEYDRSDSGQSDGRRKRSAQPTVWLGGFDDTVSPYRAR